MSNFPSIESDVLIVGAGGAGMRAAEKLASEGRQVAVISKVFPLYFPTEDCILPLYT